jgi:ssDNA-binding Zn-finger/Zn-ribbon topoisomerase 1
MQRVLGRNGAFYGCINYPNCRGSRNIKTGPGACPTCGAPTEARVGRNGPFYGCTKYPDCKGTLNFDLDTVLTLPKPVPKKKPAKPPRAQPPPTPLQPGLLDPAPPLPPDLLYDPEDEQDASQDEDDEPWLFDDE